MPSSINKIGKKKKMTLIIEISNQISFSDLPIIIKKEEKSIILYTISRESQKREA